ncbi:carboxypeptidase-like regulatory domain-containing protein [Solirubrobacter taibaiensis]|nr:carboxypeptidase-like regulatory domain-containing protein [Solirubrobacter taibaiensis]
MTHARHQDGFAVIEVIVSAAVLAIIALAVFAGIDGATASTARERARAVSASLAEQDQERLRSYRFDELTKLVGLKVDDAKINRTLNVDGVNYNVNSQVTLQVDDGTPTTGCGAAGAKQNEYLRIVSTVTSAMVGVRIAPAKIESLVSPPVSGSLVVKVLTARNVGVANVAVTATNAKTGRSYPGTTNGDGCALFVGIESGTYTVNINKPGYVDRAAEQDSTVTTTVSPNLVNVVTMSYDIAVNMQVNVKTLRPGTTFSTSATTYPSKAVAISDNSADQSTLRTYTPSTPSATVEPSKLFPFTTAYSYFTGTCAIQSPVKVGLTNYFSTTNTAAAVIGDPAKPQPQVATVYQPAVNLRLRATASSSSASVDASNVKVFFYLQKVGADSCDDFQGTQMGVKTWPGGTWGSTLPSPVAATATRNWVVQNSTDFDPGLPFGTYKVCLNDSGSWWTTDGTSGKPHYDNTKTAQADTREIPPTGSNGNWTTTRPSGC